MREKMNRDKEYDELILKLIRKNFGKIKLSREKKEEIDKQVEIYLDEQLADLRKK
jgi:hypothetical protein